MYGQTSLIMKNYKFKIFTLITMVLYTIASYSQSVNSELLKVADTKISSDWVLIFGKIKVEDKECYKISKGYSGVNFAKIDTFCGKITNNTGIHYLYSFQTDSYDLKAETLRPIDFTKDGEWMSVLGKIKIDDRCCYAVKKSISYDGDMRCQLDTFCGRFKNFDYEDEHLFRLYVDKFDLQSDTISVQQIYVGEFIKIAPFRGKINGKQCYLTKRCGKQHKEWDAFCGELSTLSSLPENVETTVLVKKYDIHADTIQVLSFLCADSSPEYRAIRLKQARINNSDDIHVRVDDKLYYWVGKNKLSTDENDLKHKRK